MAKTVCMSAHDIARAASTLAGRRTIDGSSD
jgi:hypothetical protein